MANETQILTGSNENQSTEQVTTVPTPEEPANEVIESESVAAESSVGEPNAAEDLQSEPIAAEADTDEIPMTGEPLPEQSSNLELLQSEVAKIAEQTAELTKLFKARILHSEYETKVVDGMHKELQKYKEDMYSQLVRPILLDVINMRDSILRVAAEHMKKPEGEQSVSLKTFELYSYDAMEILEKNNIEAYKSEADIAFIPVRQRVVSKTPTADKELHGKVAQSLSDGYSYMGKTIAPEKVAVYVYEESQNPPPPEAVENNNQQNESDRVIEEEIENG